jgi:predicted ATP-grasp superfamily ATP-dependent carboligase
MSHAGSEPLGGADRSMPIFVLRRSLGPFQHCMLAVTRTAGRLGIPVYAVRASDREPAARSRYLSGALDLPASLPERDWVQRLITLGEQIGTAVLLPVDDLAAVVVGDHQDALAERFVLPRQPIGVQRLLASKRELWKLCLKLDLPAPVSSFPTSPRELLDHAAGSDFPVVLKRAEPWLPSRDPAAPSVAIVHDQDELERCYERMESDVRPQVMVQDFIPGGSDSVWMFNGCFGAGAKCLFGATGRKLRQRAAGTGPTSLGVCTPNAEVRSAAERLMRELDYRGIVDMGFRYDARDGKYKLLDVNPRLGSTFRLFASDNLDVVRALHLDLTGRPVPAASTVNGRTWLDEPGDLITCARMIREGSLTVGHWLRSLRGIDEAAWWAADDPLPFMTMTARAGPHGLRSLARLRATTRADAEAAVG